MNFALYNPAWGNLKTDEKEQLIRNVIDNLRIPFEFVCMEQFKRNGVTTETAILRCGDSEFVFVPGAFHITLGWDDGIAGLEGMLGLQEEFDMQVRPLEYAKRCASESKEPEAYEYFQERIKALEEHSYELPEEMLSFYSTKGLIKYINDQTSPVRFVDICPIIAERHNREAGLRFVGLYHPENHTHTLSELDYNDLEKYLTTEFCPSKSMSVPSIEYSDCCRFVQNNDQTYSIYRMEPITRDKLKIQLSEEGFTIPTEDEWEYLCGAGTRTLFPFGNHFDEAMRYRHIGDHDESVLDEPNMFGLQIAYDQYHYEIVDSECLSKGGDGGCSVCGGESFTYMMLPLSTYWQNCDWKLVDEYDHPDEVELQGGYYWYRRIIRLNV